MRLRVKPHTWLLLSAMVIGLGQQARAQALTNDDVVKMVQAELPESVVIGKIKSSKCEFDTSPDALIKLKRAGVSAAVLEAMTEAAVPSPRLPASARTAAVPTAYGYYALDGQETRTLTPVEVATKICLAVGGNTRSGKGFAVDGLAGDPPLTIHHSDWTLIVYQQNVSINDLHLSELVYVARMNAFEFNAPNTNPQFFRSIYGRDYNETIAIDLWRPKGEVSLRIEPIEGKPGMYRLVPSSPLRAGRFALYDGTAIHQDGMIFGTEAGRRSWALYFELSSAPSQPSWEEATKLATSAAAASAAPNGGEQGQQVSGTGQTFSFRHRHNALFSPGSQAQYYCSGTLSISPDGSVAFNCEQTDDPSGRCDHVSFAKGSLKQVKIRFGVLHLASKSQGNFDFLGDRTSIRQAFDAISPLVQN